MIRRLISICSAALLLLCMCGGCARATSKDDALIALGRYEEALKAYEQTIKVNPDDAEAWANKGIALGHLGRYEEALQAFDQAIKIDSNCAYAWYNKGSLLG